MIRQQTASARKLGGRPLAGAWRPGRRVAPLAGAAAVVVLAVLAAFLPVLGNGFVPLDDNENFLSNLAYRGLGGANLAWMWTARHMGHYIPLTWMTLGADYLLWGMDPFGYHLTSLLLHLANSLLLLLLAGRLLRLASPAWSRWRSRGAVAAGATVAALAFAVHPLRVESVAWVSERRDVLCGFFVLLTLLAYTAAKAAAAAGRRDRRWLLLAAACGFYAAALLSKGIAVALPVALVALDASVLGRLAAPKRPEEQERNGESAGELEKGCERAAAPAPEQACGSVAWREKLPFVALAAGSAVVTLWASRPVLVPALRLSLSARLAAAAYGLVFYLRQTVLPVRIPFLVPWLAGVELARPAIAWRAAALVVGAAALFALRRRARAWCAAGAAFATYVAFVLPVSGLLQAGPQLAASRYSYLSCLPWALLAGAGVTSFLVGSSANAGGAAGIAEARGSGVGVEEARAGAAGVEEARASAVLGGVSGREATAIGPVGWRWALAAVVVITASSGLIVATRHEVERWHDDFSFSAAGIASAPTAWPPRFTLARALLRAGRWREAATQVRVGLRFSPAAVPLDIMGALLLASCPDATVRSGREALALAERASRATSYRGPAALEALAAAHAELGDFPRAQAEAERALALCRMRPAGSGRADPALLASSRDRGSAGQPRADSPLAGRLARELALYARRRPLRLAPGDWS